MPGVWCVCRGFFEKLGGVAWFLGGEDVVFCVVERGVWGAYFGCGIMRQVSGIYFWIPVLGIFGEEQAGLRRGLESLLVWGCEMKRRFPSGMTTREAGATATAKAKCGGLSTAQLTV